MCGIVGLLSRTGTDLVAVRRACDSLTHRGPDHGGVWRSHDGRVALAHRRLAIIAPNPEGNQPFVTQDGRFVLTFNGEIYNYRALRQELMAHGARFRTATDTEVLVEAYRFWGVRCLERLSGMFAFGLWDELKKELFLARDRAGEKPLYYAQVSGEFLFASELKALAMWPGFQRRLSMPAVADFLTFGFVPDPKCIWEGCHKLPPAHWLRVSLAGGQPRVEPSPTRYWDISFAADRNIDDWGEELRGALEFAAKEMAVADVPLGTFLSGGVDSSAVTAALCRSGSRVRSFTIGFDEPGYDERPFAQLVADRYGTQHVARTVTADDAEAANRTLLWHYDEPFNDYSCLPTYYLCRSARAEITVALSGDGGDELFAGYRKYQRLGLRDHVQRLLPEPLTPVLAGASRRLGARTRIGRTLAQHTVPPAAALADMLTLGFGPTALRTAARGALRRLLEDYSPYQVVHEHLAHAPPNEVGLVNAMRYLDLKLTLAGGILVKVDRASMAVSLEVRPVFLHRDIMALAGRIPPRLLAGATKSKDALKQALRPWLPDAVLFRKKQGFALPLGTWIRNGGSKAVVRESVRSADLLDPGLLGRLVTAHTDGKSDHTATIHSLTLLERWLEHWEAA